MGCDYIINGGLYNVSNQKPVIKLKADGKIYTTDQWNYNGIAWDNPPLNFGFELLDPKLSTAKANAIACVCLRMNNVKQEYALTSAQNDKAIGYAAARTCIGMKNGQLALFLSSTGMRPNAVYDYLTKEGWSDILMLDGGGSTQGYLGSGKQVTSSRKVSNYICVYLYKDSVSQNNTTTAKNPYPIPTRAIIRGCKGQDVKWVQFELIRSGSDIAVDGSCGPATVAAIKEFQKKYGLSVDGRCGPATRAALMSH